jgi:hypothetical protein
MWQISQYLNFDVQSGYHTLDEDFGFSFNTAVRSSLQDLNAIRIYLNHNYGISNFNTSVLLQVIKYSIECGTKKKKKNSYLKI